MQTHQLVAGIALLMESALKLSQHSTVIPGTASAGH
jgi:hypothetical protein